MNNGIPVIRKHKNFLEIFTCADLEFKNVFLGFGCDFLQVSDRISNSNCRRILVDTSDSVTLFEDVLCDPVDRLYQVVFSDALSVHQKHTRNDTSAENDQPISHFVNDLFS